MAVTGALERGNLFEKGLAAREWGWAGKKGLGRRHLDNGLGIREDCHGHAFPGQGDHRFPQQRMESLFSIYHSPTGLARKRYGRKRHRHRLGSAEAVGKARFFLTLSL